MFNKMGRQRKIFASKPRVDNGKKNPPAPFIIIASAIIILLAVGVGAMAFHPAGKVIPQINSKYATNLSKSPFLFELNNTEYAVYLHSASASSADIYVQKLPNFINNVLSVELHENNSTKINLGSVYADLEIKLNAVSKNFNSINISMYPLQQYLLIKPDSGSISIVTSYSQPSSTTAPSQNSTTSSQPPTTSTSTTTTTSPSSTTTTSSSSSSANESLALNLIKANSYYVLMQNYSAMYANAASNCTSSLYNSSYLAKYGSNPPAGSYLNAKSNSPSQISMGESAKGAIVSFSYKSVSSVPAIAGTVLVLSVDVSSSAISNSTFSGIFSGSNYQTMLSNYHTIAGVGNACGIYVV
ncbi:MAG: hypothetical protein M1331_02125 [Candidatus Marsarchaeota archaeon]|nr:hypothetical protein [Candidatus Marsarchaeota archaeon]